MTISSTANKAIRYGNGVATSWPYKFLIPSASQLSIIITDPQGNQSPLTPSQYTVSGIGSRNGGTVTYPLSGSPLAIGWSITIVRTLPIVQLTDIVNQDGFYPDVLEDSADYLTMVDQQLSESLSRTMSFPIVDDLTSVSPTLPAASARSNMALAFDGNGNPTLMQPGQLSTVPSTNVTTPDVVLSTLMKIGLNRVVDSIAQLRTLSKTIYTRAFATGYYRPHGGGGGAYQLDPTDLSSADNGGTIIVANDDGRWKLQYFGFVTLRQFGAVMNYANGSGTDDSAALTNALNAMSGTGGEVRLDSDGVAYVASSITIPAGVRLRGPFDTPDSVASMQTNPIGILSLGGAIALNSAATITVGGGATVDGVLVYRAGISIPAPNANAFAGTAFTVGGPGASIRKSLVVGFNELVYSNGYERLKVEWFYGDGQNGIEVTNAADIPRLAFVHLWPFATYSPTAPIANHYRTGKGIYVHDGVSAITMLDCFAFCYAACFYFSNVATIRWIGCMADGDPNQPNSVGLSLNGNINGLLGTSNAIWSRATGVSVNMNVGQFVDLTDLMLDTIGGAGIDLVGGGVDVSDCVFANMTNALRVENLNVEAYFDRNQFTGISGDVVSCVTPGTVNVVIGPNNYNLDNTAAATLNTSNLGLQGLLVAASVNLNPNFHDYFMNGLGTISAIAGGWKGRTVRIKFNGTATVQSGTGSATAIRLSGGSNYTSSAGSVLTLMHDGTQWYEVSRTT